MPHVFKTWQIMYGFDTSVFGGKVVSVTVLTMRMTHFLVHVCLIWDELGRQFCASPPTSFGLFFDRPQEGLRLDWHPTTTL